MFLSQSGSGLTAALFEIHMLLLRDQEMPAVLVAHIQIVSIRPTEKSIVLQLLRCTVNNTV